MSWLKTSCVVAVVSAISGASLELMPANGSSEITMPRVIARAASAQHLGNLPHSMCAPMVTPAAAFATQSKYASDSAAHDVLDSAAYEQRRGLLGEAQTGVRIMQALVAAPPTSPSVAYDCAATYVLQWARAGALTMPETDDANRTLARLTADLAVVVLRLDTAGYLDGVDRTTVNLWLTTLATTVRHYFDNDAGPISRQNNHRYWAALALAGVGKQTANHDDVAWAVASYAVGVCQVTTDGFLPLELSRRTQARNYHLYAYEALHAVQQLLPDETARVAIECREGLQRLAHTVTRVDSGSLFQSITGVAQAEMARRPDLVSLLIPTAT